MVTAADILQQIETIAPSYMKESWDNVGLLCGSAAQPVTKVLVALDPFLNVCEEAAAWGAELLVTHHPLIFGSIQSVTDQTATGKAIQYLCCHGISAINAHTNLDCAPGGVNDILAGRLGLENVEVIDPAGVDSQGKPYGLLRMGTVEEQPAETFLARVKSALGNQGLRYVNPNPTVRRVAVGGGACGSEVMAAARAGCDTFVTADVKYNQFRDAYDLGLNLIDAGHFHTENPVCAYLADKIRGAFPEIQVKIAENHTDPMKFF